MIIESVLVHLACNAGLGRHLEALTQKEFDKYSKVLTFPHEVRASSDK
jgi:hypothetical protein